MAEAKKKAKKEDKKTTTGYKLIKPNGRVIYRDAVGDAKMKRIKAKGWKVEEI